MCSCKIRGLGRAASVLIMAGAPATVLACACGCGVFDVGTTAMFPGHSGGMVFLEQDFMDQNRNWSGTSQAPADANPDRRIRTNFWMAGLQYMFGREWGMSVEVPWWQRRFVTTEDPGQPQSFDHGALGDIRLRALYTGFSPNLSTGVGLGVKLPTGDSRYAGFDPDTQIGTGSTDLLVTGYHVGALTGDNQLSWFANVQWELPLAHRSGYRPGAEVDGGLGLYYRGWELGAAARFAPILQINGVWRGHDAGALADPENTGYTRAFAAPGFELDFGQARVDAMAAFPFYTNASGNQLVATALYKLNVSWRF